jgi:hypothetical protein
MTRQLFVGGVLPIGATAPGGLCLGTLKRPPGASGVLFSGTLWFSNAAYTYLSVSFIQMLKALMPAAVYTCSVFWVRTNTAAYFVRRAVGAVAEAHTVPAN